VAGGPVYLVVSVLATADFLRRAWAVRRRDQAAAEADRFRAEKKLFGVSIVYLFAIFGAFIADALLRALAAPLGWPVWF